VRNDSGCYEGAEIPVHYDPMISKLVVWGEDRAAACGRMRRALDEYQVRGIETNLPFHRLALRHPQFLAGEFDTGFIGREQASLTPGAEGPTLEAAMIAAAIDAASRGKLAQPAATTNGVNSNGNGSNGKSDPAAPSAWRTGSRGWRNA
jgi:acetyl/propionyl-CoA carboxylase alpha subunit